MVMSVTEASAAQYVLQFAASELRLMRTRKIPGEAIVVVDEDGGRGVTLDQLSSACHVLAEQSYKKLHAGLDGRRWDELSNLPGGDDHDQS